jgi:hypothetical protein
MPKRAKDEVDYSEGMSESHCGSLRASDTGFCKHFRAQRTTEIGRCVLVQGPIKRNYWCKLFEKAE